jgi:hypothetical protein
MGKCVAGTEKVNSATLVQLETGKRMERFRTLPFAFRLFYVRTVNKTHMSNTEFPAANQMES